MGTCLHSRLVPGYGMLRVNKIGILALTERSFICSGPVSRMMRLAGPGVVFATGGAFDDPQFGMYSFGDVFYNISEDFCNGAGWRGFDGGFVVSPPYYQANFTTPCVGSSMVEWVQTDSEVKNRPSSILHFAG